MARPGYFDILIGGEYPFVLPGSLGGNVAIMSGLPVQFSQNHLHRSLLLWLILILVLVDYFLWFVAAVLQLIISFHCQPTVCEITTKSMDLALYR